MFKEFPETSKTVEPCVFEAEDIAVLRVALDHAWEFVPPRRRTPATKTNLAVAVVRLAGYGERDPGRLSFGALRVVIPEAPRAPP